MSRIPVTLITGFLGAGKTTLLNRLIEQGGLDKAALIINEFGDIGIDHLLVETADDTIMQLEGGCLCCTLRGDLADTLSRLLERDEPPDRIVIETTGIADPLPIMQTVMGNAQIANALHLDGVACVLDAVAGTETLRSEAEARQQIALADAILISKTDLAPLDEALKSALGALNSHAACYDIFCDKPSLSELTGLHSQQRAPAELRQNGTRHDAYQSVSIESEIAVDRGALDSFLALLISQRHLEVLRVKGLVKIRGEPDKPLEIHGIRSVFSEPLFRDHWPEGAMTTRLVIIGRNLDTAYLRGLFDSLTGKPQIDAPDRQALTDNPLAVRGFG